MRNLFLALVLANLAFAAYHYWFATAPLPDRTGGSAPTLVLASEVDVGAAPAIAGLAAEAAPADNVTAELPPVTGSDAAAAASDRAPLADGADSVDADAAGGLLAATEQPAAARDRTASDADSVAAFNEGSAPTVDAAQERLATVTQATRCVSVGPFRELSQAATAAANLRAGGLDPSQRAGEGEIWVGYWVYIEQIASVEDGEEILQALRENGISDSYVIPRSDSGTLVSLGVFTEINRATSRREVVRSLGFDATISDRTRRATVYWIEVNLADGQLLDFEQLQPPGRIVRLEQRECGDGLI